MDEEEAGHDTDQSEDTEHSPNNDGRADSFLLRARAMRILGEVWVHGPD